MFLKKWDVIRQIQRCFQWERQSIQVLKYIESVQYWTHQCQAEAELPPPFIAEHVQTETTGVGIKKATSSRNISMRTTSPSLSSMPPATPAADA